MRTAFRLMTGLTFAAPAVAFAFVPACKLPHGQGADGGGDAAPSASTAASETPAASSSASAPDAAAAPTHPFRPSGPPAAGNECREAIEATACAPGGFEKLACVGGVWKVAETCRGAGGCKAVGTSVQCDPGTPRAGDACPATAAPHCSNVHTVFTCKDGAWESSLCVPPSKCVPNAKNGVAGCK
jgi:hypothetical protein